MELQPAHIEDPFTHAHECNKFQPPPQHLTHVSVFLQFINAMTDCCVLDPSPTFLDTFIHEQYDDSHLLLRTTALLLHPELLLPMTPGRCY